MAKSYRPGGVGMVPAEPGTYLVNVYFDDNQVELVKANVLGWQISTERIVTPLVVDPSAAAVDVWHVLQADGRVECNDGRCWNDLDSWIADQHRNQAEAAEAITVPATKKQADPPIPPQY